MKNSTNFIIDSGAFPFEVLCFFGTKKDLLLCCNEYFENKDIKYLKRMDFNCRGRAIRFENNKTILWMPVVPLLTTDFAVLAHEIFHCANLILEKVLELKLQANKTDEIYAYMIEYYTKQIYTNLGYK